MPDYRNPFIFGGPVPPRYFIGREKEVRTVLDRLANPAHGSTAVSGEARIGKTSFLHYISSPEIAETWGLSPGKYVFIVVDSQTIVPFSLMGFWRYVLKSLAARKVHDPGYIASLLQEDDVGGFELGELFDRIARDDKLVILLLDEFEHIVEHVNPSDPQFLYRLRALINRPAHGLALVLASRKPLENLCQNMRFAGAPFPTSFASLALDPFSPEEANRLIDVYTQDTGVTFSNRDREFAYYGISKGYPYQLQEVCFQLFQRYKEKVRMSDEQLSFLDGSDYEMIAVEMEPFSSEEANELKIDSEEDYKEPKAKPRWPQMSIRELAIHRISRALASIGLVVSIILLVLASALWYKYVYPETIVGTQITPDGIGYSVRYSEWIGVGDTEQFRITLTNEGTQSLSSVRVYLDFSDAATVAPPPGHSLTADVATLPMKNIWADKIEFCLEQVSEADIVQADLLIVSDELGEQLLNTYTFKVIDVPKNLIRRFLEGVGVLAGALLMALVGGWAIGIGSSRGEG